MKAMEQILERPFGICFNFIFARIFVFRCQSGFTASERILPLCSAGIKYIRDEKPEKDEMMIMEQA